MNLNNKVPLNCSSEDTSKMFMIAVKNINAISLYTKNCLISSHGLKHCISNRITRSAKWLDVE